MGTESTGEISDRSALAKEATSAMSGIGTEARQLHNSITDFPKKSSDPSVTIVR